jgi:alkylhydroperoxidase family enzyme
VSARVAPAGPAEAVLARLPDLLRCHAERREAIFASSLLEPELMDACRRYLAEDDDVIRHADDSERFSERERAALAWAHASTWSPDSADDELWARLHASFTEPELVQLFYYLQWEIGNRAWLTTLGLPADAANPPQRAT